MYAWSHFTTKGKYKYAESVAEGEQDSLYVIVERDFKSGTVMCIERFEPMYNADNNNVYMDCYIRQTSTENISTITVPHLIGEDVQIVVNGRERPIKEVPPTAIINIDGEAQSVAVGINYTTRLRILYRHSNYIVVIRYVYCQNSMECTQPMHLYVFCTKNLTHLTF